ncbi:MAG: hypothetical protein A2096_02085 [Spirochaetes bacterium GWF1_41_5]|nr:MAG: hypothetical protein A2096_02085 [Spirochaetes bacterium GWF1_41_5]
MNITDNSASDQACFYHLRYYNEILLKIIWKNQKYLWKIYIPQSRYIVRLVVYPFSKKKPGICYEHGHNFFSWVRAYI